MRLVSSKLNPAEARIITELYLAARRDSPSLTLKQFTTALIIRSVEDIIKKIKETREVAPEKKENE